MIQQGMRRKITLGTHETAEELRQALVGSGCLVTDWADELLEKITLCPVDKTAEVELALSSVMELGFPDRATGRQIYGKARRLGHEICPAEVGPQVVMQCVDLLAELDEDELLVAMKPITDARGCLCVFTVGRDECGHLWLDAYFAPPSDDWDPDSRWMFLSGT